MTTAKKAAPRIKVQSKPDLALELFGSTFIAISALGVVTFVAIVASLYILFHLRDANPDRSLAILIAAGAFVVQVGTTLYRREK